MDQAGEIHPCKHLVLVHLNIADPAIMYARPDLTDATEECSGWDEIEDKLQSWDGLDELLVIEECTTGPAMAEFQIVYGYFDEE
jgi:hypothetical protein